MIKGVSFAALPFNIPKYTGETGLGLTDSLPKEYNKFISTDGMIRIYPNVEKES